jgi:hypothetical protein
MSIAKTCDSVSTQTFDTDPCQPHDSAARPLVGKAKRAAAATRLRLPNKTQWALDDMLRHAKEGREGMQTMLEWIERERLDAKGHYDTPRLARLGELSHIVAGVALHVGELERLASDARAGIYVESQPRKQNGASNGAKP